MQAQEYAAAKWAIAARIPGITDADLEHQIAAGQLLRTWPMRGTIHFVQPEDAHWMLALMTPRVFNKYKRIYGEVGLVEADFTKAAEILEAVMKDGTQLTRPQMKEILEQAGVDTSGQRMYHIIVYLAHHGLLAITSLQGKQPQFAWFDTWVPKEKRRQLSTDEALAEMARRYIQSHSPVTVHDFAWWTGLTVGDSRRAFALLADQIIPLPEDNTFWMSADMPDPASIPDTVHLAPPFDEAIVALKDRSAVISAQDFKKVVPYTNGVFSPVILLNGQFAGLWKRTRKAKGLEFEAELVRPLSKRHTQMLETEIERYAKYLGVPLLSSKTSRM